MKRLQLSLVAMDVIVRMRQKAVRRGPILWSVAWAIAISTGWACWQEAEKDRKWKDSSGKFEVTATLVQVEGDTVTLRTSDGKTLTIKVSQLSDEDRNYLKSSSPDSSADQLSAFETQSSSTSRNARMVFHTGRRLDLSGPEIWNVPPDPAPAWTMALNQIAMPGAYSWHVSLLQAPHSPHAVLIDSTPQEYRAQLLDCSKPDGINSEPFSIPKAKSLCLSPGGRRLLMGSGRFGEGPIDVAVLDLQNSSAQIRFRWLAFNEPEYLHREVFGGVRAARFVDDRYLLTFHRRLCALWDVDRGELKWWTYRDGHPDFGVFDMSAAFAVSPGGKQLFFVEQEHLVGVSLPEGKLIAKKAIDRPLRSLSISPDGKRLIALSGVLSCMDLATGDAEFMLGIGVIRGPSGMGSLSIRWVDAQNVVIEDRSSIAWIDLNQKRELALLEQAVKFGGEGVELLLDGQGTVAYTATRDIPEDKLKMNVGIFRLDRDAVLAMPGPKRAQNNLDLEPGDAVSVNLQLRYNNINGSQTDVSLQMLPIVEDLLRTKGFVVEPDSPKNFRLEWNIAAKIVEREALVRGNDNQSSPKQEADDKMQPQTGLARSVSDLEDKPNGQTNGQSNNQLDMPKVVATTVDWTEHNCGIYVGGTNVHWLTRHHLRSVFDLPLTDRIQWTLRRMEIPNYVSAYRGDVVVLDYEKIWERPDSNPLSPNYGAQPGRDR